MASLCGEEKTWNLTLFNSDIYAEAQISCEFLTC